MELTTLDNTVAIATPLTVMRNTNTNTKFNTTFKHPVFGLILIQAELPVFLFVLISNKKELPQFGSSFYFISINTVNSINPRS